MSVTEGKATIQSIENDDGTIKEVFYNPAQVFNRDLSLLVLKSFADTRQAEIEQKHQKTLKKRTAAAVESVTPQWQGLKIIEPLAASGLRSIRYALELGDDVQYCVANDLDGRAARHALHNVNSNGVHEKVFVTLADANALLFSQFRCLSKDQPDPRTCDLESLPRPDVIDVDPYGSVVPFLDSAVRAVADGGLLCLTSTDMPVLGANCPEVSFYKYGGNALKAKWLHEMSLRLVLLATQQCANRAGRHMEPLVSLSVDFYCRVFVRIVDSKVKCKLSASRTAFVLQCTQCPAFHTIPFGRHEPKGDGSFTDAHGQPSGSFKVGRWPDISSSCEQCGGRYSMGGPFYSGPLHSKPFVTALLQLCKTPPATMQLAMTRKIQGTLSAILGEQEAPLFFHLPSLCHFAKLTQMKTEVFRAGLRSLGYASSYFHRDPQAIKTTAPTGVVMAVLRAYKKKTDELSDSWPDMLKNFYNGSCLSEKDEQTVEWTVTDADKPQQEGALFLPNPKKHWGPGSLPGSKRKKTPHETDAV
ncbi:MAG: hypothetical protein KVP17_000417 [Porospora cf. gigantea B]|uniref:uncharacterized protein n=2 Tax=Porospora cf. gigantea B TaxID=2853592 RepID=UPI0035717DCA|nr:MAG: hypothetical protein KVP17_000417 [Porospora cf. gigantea B]